MLACSLGAALAPCVGVAALLSPSLARAAPSNALNQARLDSTVRYLQDVQNPDGGFSGDGAPGEESNSDFTAWVALALAAAGINPRAQAKPGGVSAYTYLLDNAAEALPDELCSPAVCTTGFERELLVVDAAGTSPRDFAGFDLVGEILARKLPDGSFPYTPGGRGEVNDTVFAILSLGLVEEPAAQAALGPAAEWLIGQQNSDGGWSWQNKGDPTNLDLTGAAIEALNAAGTHHSEAQARALRFLHEAQDPDGGFPQQTGEHESNVGSTAWVTQGLWAAGENPEAWVQSTTGKEPLGYMESMQQPDGHIRYEASEESNGVWMTAYAAPAFAGQPLPIPAVPDDEAESNPPPSGSQASAPPASGTGEAGQGGESAQPGSGVIAGGGGDGAALFSRPQPQSEGETPGGVRLLDSTRTKRLRTAANKDAKRRRNPGAPRKTPAPTTTTATLASGGAGSDDGSNIGGSSGGGGNSGGGNIGSSSSRHGGKGAGGSESGGVPVNVGRTSAVARGMGREVSGVAIGAPGSRHGGDAPEPGAPGLHSTGRGGGTPWLALAIGAAAALLALAGSAIERKRPEMVV